MRASPEKVIAVLEVFVIFVVPASVKVRLVDVVVSHTVPVPVSVQRPVPLVRVRMLELEEEKIPQVTFLLLASKVPFVRVRVRADAPSMLRLSWRVQEPPTILIGEFHALPFVVMVAPSAMLNSEITEALLTIVIVGDSTMLPKIVVYPGDHVPENPVKLRLLHRNDPLEVSDNVSDPPVT